VLSSPLDIDTAGFSVFVNIMKTERRKKKGFSNVFDIQHKSVLLHKQLLIIKA